MIKRDILNEDLVVIIDYNDYAKRSVKALSMQDYEGIVKILDIVKTAYNNMKLLSTKPKPADMIMKNVPFNYSGRYCECILKNLFGADYKGNIVYPTSIEEIRIVNDRGCFSIL